MNLKRNINFFKQNDIYRFIGAGLLIGGILWFWLGWSAASYYGPCVMVPVGLALFLVTSARHVPESEIRQSLARSLADVGEDVTQKPDFTARSISAMVPYRAESFYFTEPATMFRRGKDSRVLSDVYGVTAIFFTHDALLVRGRRVSLATGESEDTCLNIAWEQVGAAELIPYEQSVTLTNTRGKRAAVRGAWLQINDTDGRLLYRAPVADDMDAQTLCENIARCCTAR